MTNAIGVIEVSLTVRYLEFTLPLPQVPPSFEHKTIVISRANVTHHPRQRQKALHCKSVMH